jgi:putative lipoprotein
MSLNQLFLRLGLVFLLGLGSCSSGEKADPPPADAGEPASTVTTAIIRGHLIIGHEIRSLRPCGQDDELWVIDRTDLLADLHAELTAGAQPYAEVFAVVGGRTVPPPTEGFGADFAGALTVTEVLYVAGEGLDCDFAWDRFLFRAQGNEPFWTVEVLPDRMSLTRPGQDDLVWTEVRETRTEEALNFVGLGENQAPIELIITADPGRDTMSGAYYGLSARLDFAGQSFTGNALKGTGPPSE